MEALLTEASRDGREVAIVLRSDPPASVIFQSADVLLTQLPGLAPKAWGAQDTAWTDDLPTNLETYWFSDGLTDATEEDLLHTLQSLGPVRAFESPFGAIALTPALFEDGAIAVTALRRDAGVPRDVAIAAVGLDPSGTERTLARETATFEPNSETLTLRFDLPAELRNRITRFEIERTRSAGAVTLTDDALRRREVALIAGSSDREGLALLSPLHYLSRALVPTADLIDGALDDVLLANPDVIILADVAQLSPAETERVQAWLDEGGLLVRFAGPRLAASDVGREEEDPLLPVRLRIGGRTVGGAMSWGEPKSLAPFAETSPFLGLSIPEDVRVNAQVLAQPDPTLAERTIANLADGTPLVTRKDVGQGAVILFHVTANAEWSTLPLAGLFVEMLERLAISTSSARPDRADLDGTTWVPDTVLTAFGQPRDAGTQPGVSGERFLEEATGHKLFPSI